MEVVSSLEPFLNDDGNPVKANRSWGGGIGGSGGGIRTPDTRIMIPLL